MIEIEWLQPASTGALEAVRAMRREAMDWDIEQTAAIGVRAETLIRSWYERERLDDSFAPGCGLLVARAGDAIPGTAALRRLDAARCEVRRLFVRPACRRAGTGRVMLEALLERARASGYSQALLETATFMTDAHRLYARMGFSPCASYGGPTPAEVRHLTLYFSRAL